ncbi:hypothetical protein BS35_005969 [Actinomadura glauciflava]|nr:hypothetical protein [Actinomadura glauciflava]
MSRTTTTPKGEAALPSREIPVPLPLLWVFACGPEEHAGMVVGVRSACGGTWGYY